ncbi:MAG: DUF4215 domain-containing protein [bacterium]|nr:DUF4215 domain-containing protein [bacterium]
MKSISKRILNIISVMFLLIVSASCVVAGSTINSVVFNGGSNVSIFPGDLITVTMSVTTEGFPYNDWRTTQYSFGGTPECIGDPEPDFESPGTYVDSFVIPAPGTPGTYSISFWSANSIGCDYLSGEYYMPDAIVVENPFVCGDGSKDLGEQCDDGNTDPGDGCNDVCEIEEGWDCSSGSPSVCSEICGDSTLTGAEECDDGNTANGDGCSDICEVEEGWICDGAFCSEVCGDNILTPSEECDDGNTADGDGCDSLCMLEVCGDGVVQPVEECDDGNTANGDGCDDTCAIEAGWDCDQEPSTCEEVCGDDILTASEECDDGNTVSGDGCDEFCQLECVPATEVCDGLDNDCDYEIDEDLGETTCGLGVCENTVDNCVDGEDQVCDPFEGSSEEICDGLDNDCDGETDEGGVCDSEDSDSDGVPDVDDKCDDSTPWYATKRLNPNHYDSSNMDLTETYGCTCEQILECKPGKNKGQYKHGCSNGTLKGWIKQKKWATKCQD